MTTHLVSCKILINQISSLSFLYKKLEKRRSESLEQKVKGTHRRSVGGTGGSSNSGEATKSVRVVSKHFFPQFWQKKFASRPPSLAELQVR